MSITLRAYNVLFGDCLLVSWDEDDGEHHAWVDFGNFQNDPNAVFLPVYNDVLARTQGKLDLVVITHRHMDHLEGFYSQRDSMANDFEVKKIWYAYVKPELDDQFKIVEDTIQRLELLPKQVRMGEGFLGQLYQNNFGVLGLTVKDRMDRFLAKFPNDIIHEVFRGIDVDGIVPQGMNKLKLDVLAPEYDSGAYFEPIVDALRMRKEMDDHLDEKNSLKKLQESDAPFIQSDNKGMEESPLDKLADFARLRRKVQSGGLDLLYATDRTRNNTSVVLSLTYEGKRILLAGDAEEKSWELMQNHGVNLAADLIKVAHHGSINASPNWSYDTVFTENKATNAVIISTDPTRYPPEKNDNEVPKDEVLEGWKNRVQDEAIYFKRTDEVDLEKSVEVKYD